MKKAGQERKGARRDKERRIRSGSKKCLRVKTLVKCLKIMKKYEKGDKENRNKKEENHSKKRKRPVSKKR